MADDDPAAAPAPVAATEEPATSADADPAEPAAAANEPAASPEPVVAARTARPVRRAQLAFRQWRRTRPFWAAVWSLWGGFVILYFPLAPMGRILRVGIGGIYGMAGGVIIMGLALLLLILPNQRHVAGIVIVVVGTASFPLSNLGGFFVGMFFSILGGVMAFGWMPAKPPRKWRMLRRIRPVEGPTASAAADIAAEGSAA